MPRKTATLRKRDGRLDAGRPGRALREAQANARAIGRVVDALARPGAAAACVRDTMLVVCGSLGWSYAAFWSLDDGGALALVEEVGELAGRLSAEDPGRVARLAAHPGPGHVALVDRAADLFSSARSAGARVAVHATVDRRGVLELVGATPGALDTERLETIRTIARLLATTLEQMALAERQRRQQEGLRDGVEEVLRVVSAAADGDLTIAPDQRGDDTIDRISDAFALLLGDLRSNVSAIARNAQSLAASAGELSAVSTEMSSNASETSAQANTVSSAAEQISGSIQTVSGGMQKIVGNVQEIARNANEAASVANTAVAVADGASRTMAKLGESSTEIGKVVKVIHSIAQQTNLLALNATIEAARAGEAGRGFAVVATEVKELARGTARATEDIGQKVEAIQADTRDAVAAIAQIADTIGLIAKYQAVIASAVEEQMSTTNRIGQSLADVATGSAEIARNISGVADAAQGTTAGAASMQAAAAELASMAGELQQTVGRFRY